MSFFSTNRQCCTPGPICGNPLNGLCEKACIQTKKVFDACMKQLQETNLDLTLTSFTPASPTYPLTYTGCTFNPDGTTINNLQVERFEDKPCFARVSGDVTVPVTVSYVDSAGVSGVASTSITIPEDVVLYIPQPSIVPYQITAFVYGVCTTGSITEETATISCCLTIILRVVVDAEILVPTYGYCQIPPCQEYAQDSCSNIFDLPLYPAQQPVSPPTTTLN